MNCDKALKNLPSLLLDAEAISSEARSHLADCDSCASELESMKAIFALLDEWPAPNPSPFFDSRLYARLREAQAEAPPGIVERMQAWLRYGTAIHAWRWAALAISLLTIGGGSVAVLEFSAKPAATSTTIKDLQFFDSNAQFVQQMNALDED